MKGSVGMVMQLDYGTDKNPTRRSEIRRHAKKMGWLVRHPLKRNHSEMVAVEDKRHRRVMNEISRRKPRKTGPAKIRVVSYNGLAEYQKGNRNV